MTFTLPSGSFVSPVCADLIAFDGSAIVATGQRLRFYDAMERLENVTPLQLAMATDASAWFVDGWLQAQARAGYVVFDPRTERYTLFCRLQPAEP